MSNNEKSADTAESRLNHDFRNILAGIQLISERIGAKYGNDPILAKFSEQLLKACERGSSLKENAESFPAETHESKSGTTRKINLMIIDDDTMLLEMYQEALSDMGCRVIAFEKSDEALAFYRDKSDQVDVILLDIIMPGMGGMECYKHLRQINPRAKIIFISGYAPSHDVQELLQTGAIHIQKPLKMQDLMNQVRAILKAPDGGLGKQAHISSHAMSKNSAIGKSDSIVIVEDDSILLEFLADLLGEKGYDIEAHTDPKECLENMEGREYKLALVDYRLPGINGLDLILRLKKSRPDLVAILMTGLSDNKKLREEAEESGVDYFMVKPIDMKLLDNTLANVFPDKIRPAAISVEPSRTVKHILLGDSPVMAETRRLIKRVAQSDANLIVSGETGTGKELTARALHEESLRKSNAFIPVNCAALPDNLLESELFGHEKGAFTGAVKTKKGLFEWAHNGTLFLDEIGDLNYSLQGKLLRALQERSIRRVGGSTEIPVNVRLISATNRDLEQMILAKSFREDLYYRLNVIKITMPSLRERREDIPILAAHFMERFNHHEKNRRISHISEEAMTWLGRYDWPGNVRELENLLNEMFILCHGDVVTMKDLPLRIKQAKVQCEKAEGFVEISEFLEEAKRDYVTRLLKAHSGNIMASAKTAGVNRVSFHRIVQALKIDPVMFRKKE